MENSTGQNTVESGSFVRTGASVARAAAKAGSGNYAGAAIEVVKDENLRNALLALFCVLLTVLIIVMYIFPMSVYEGIQTAVYDAREAFLSSYYSGEGGNLLKAVWSFSTSLFSGIWNSIVSAARIDDSSFSSFYSDLDGDVISTANAPGDSVYMKLSATKEKYAVRRDEILSVIKSQAGGALEEKGRAEFEAGYDSERDVYNGVVWDESGCTRDFSDILGLKLMALYAAIYDNDFGDTSLSDYLRWLGYRGGGNTCTFEVFDADVTVPSWTGTFMPSPLCAQAAAEADENAREAAAALSGFEADLAYRSAYSESFRASTDTHGASVMDMMIRVSVSSSLLPTVQECTRRLDRLCGDYSDEEYKSSRELQEAVRQYSDPEEGSVELEEYKRTEYRSVYHSKGEYNGYYSDRSKQEYYARTHSGASMPRYWQDTGYCALPFEEDRLTLEIYQNYKEVSYTAYISIVPRTADCVVKLAELSGIPSLNTEDTGEDGYAA